MADDRGVQADAALPRGPRLPVAAQALWYGVDPQGFFEAARRRHGDVFTVRIPGGTWVVLAAPAAVKEVFAGDPAVLFRVRRTSRCGRSSGRRNLLLLDGAEHLRRRRLLLPPFHGERMQTYRELMARARRRASSTVAGQPARTDACGHACRRSRST